MTNNTTTNCTGMDRAAGTSTAVETLNEVGRDE